MFHVADEVHGGNLAIHFLRCESESTGLHAVWQDSGVLFEKGMLGVDSWFVESIVEI